MANINLNDPTEKRINLVYDSKTDSYKALDLSILDKGGSTISNSTPSGAFGTVLEANLNREELYIQNLYTSPLYVKYGAGANSASFNFILAPNNTTNNGDGGSLSDLNYTGVVSVSGVSSGLYIVWERS